MRTDRPVGGSNGEAGSLVVFLHIPKTAGTTVNSVLAHQYSPEEIYEVMMRGMSLIMPRRAIMPKPLLSFSKIRRLKSALKRRHAVRAIRGHFDLSLGKWLPTGAQYFTLLRDPVERAISHYYHYRKLTTDPAHALAMQSTLTQWVGARGLVEMDNGQTRRLAGELGLPVGDVSTRTLDKAKANLADRFAVVGLTERFEESMILLHRKFNWPYRRYPACNVGQNRAWRSEVSGEVLETIENANRFDRELYQFASKLFDQAVSKVDMDKERSLVDIAPAYVAPARSGPDRPIPARPWILPELKPLFSAKTIENCIDKMRRVGKHMAQARSALFARD